MIDHRAAPDTYIFIWLSQTSIGDSPLNLLFMREKECEKPVSTWNKQTIDPIF